jgi:hypothetical protein
MKAYGEVDAEMNVFLTSVLDGGVVSFMPQSWLPFVANGKVAGLAPKLVWTIW